MKLCPLTVQLYCRVESTNQLCLFLSCSCMGIVVCHVSVVSLFMVVFFVPICISVRGSRLQALPLPFVYRCVLTKKR